MPLLANIVFLRLLAKDLLGSNFSYITVILACLIRIKKGYNPVNDAYYAIKIFKHPSSTLYHKKISEGNLQKIKEAYQKIFKEEVQTLSSLKHDHIVKIEEFYKEVDYIKKNGSSYKVTVIVMELVTNGDMFDFLNCVGLISEKIARSYFKTLIESNFLLKFSSFFNTFSSSYIKC